MTPEPITLREARERLALSQEALGAIAGINRRTISRAELAQHVPKFATRRKIAKALHLQPMQLQGPSK
jgi:DNA-binding XRE family transcriptional regulator